MKLIDNANDPMKSTIAAGFVMILLCVVSFLYGLINDRLLITSIIVTVLLSAWKVGIGK